MGNLRKVAWGLTALLLGGCATGPIMNNPKRIAPDAIPTENPAYVPLGPPSYGFVFEQTLDALDDIYEISYANRYDGRIETHPVIAPGIFQIWKAGSPSFHNRLQSSFQSIRHRSVVTIQSAQDGGFFVDVKVYRDLEDVPTPLKGAVGGAAFRGDSSVQRQHEVVEAATPSAKWIPIGRDPYLEQLILKKVVKLTGPESE
jgi:hypothetical protein